MYCAPLYCFFNRGDHLPIWYVVLALAKLSHCAPSIANRLYGRVLNVTDVAISCRDHGAFFEKYSRKGFHPGPMNGSGAAQLAVEDPLDPTNDAARSSWNVRVVRRAFDHAYQMLTIPCSLSESMLGRLVHLEPVIAERRAPDWLSEPMRAPLTLGAGGRREYGRREERRESRGGGRDGRWDDGGGRRDGGSSKKGKGGAERSKGRSPSRGSGSAKGGRDRSKSRSGKERREDKRDREEEGRHRDKRRRLDESADRNSSGRGGGGGGSSVQKKRKSGEGGQGGQDHHHHHHHHHQHHKQQQRETPPAKARQHIKFDS